MAYDAVVLLVNAWQEARYIEQSHERDVEAVAEADEASRLVRGINVERACEVVGLVGHKAYGTAGEATETDYDVLGKLRLYLKEILLVADGFDDVLNVVGHIGVGRYHVVQFVTYAVQVIRSGTHGGILHIV